MNGVRQLLRPLVADVRPAMPGWATLSLIASLQRTVLAILSILHLVMVIAVLVDLGDRGIPLAIANGGAAVLLAVLGRRPRALWIVPILVGGLGVACYLASGDLDSLAVFAACWQINFATFSAGLLLLGRTVVPAALVLSAAASATIAVALPSWGLMALTVGLTQVCIIVALRLGVSALLRFSHDADEREAVSSAAIYRMEVTRGASRRIAEDARTLHDSDINTFAAIAMGGAATSDPQLVREQCARDVERLRAIRGESQQRIRTVDEVFASRPGISVERAGLDDAALARAAESWGAERVTALVGAVGEAVTNAAKHSGADRVLVRADIVDGRLAVIVDDRGRGFDIDDADERGIETSIRRRAAEAGIDMRIESGPGVGTRVTFTDSAERIPASTPEPLGTATVVRPLTRRAGSYWGLGVTVVSLLLTLAGGTNEHLALLPMMVVMLACWAVVRATGMPRATPIAGILLALATVTVFTLSAVATGLGSADPAHWQALAATGPFVLLLASDPPRRWIVAAAGLWVAVIATLAGLAAVRSVTAAGIVVVAGLVGLGFSAVWYSFQERITALAERTAAGERRAFEARTARDALEAAQATYRRWIDGGLEESIDLLLRIARGTAPLTSAIRSECAAEESYLRQLVLIDPDLVHLGGSAIGLLRVARDRGIALRIRLGEQDAPDKPTAERIARVVKDAIDDTAPGAPLTMSVFPVAGGIRLTVAGPSIGVRERELIGPAPPPELAYATAATTSSDTPLTTGGPA